MELFQSRNYLVYSLISLLTLFSIESFASEYCDNFRSGYRSISKDVVSVPACPDEPPIVFGSQPSMQGFSDGRMSAKTSLNVSIDDYGRGDDKGFGLLPRFDITFLINSVFLFVFGVYGLSGFLQYIFLKEIIFFRIRSNHKHIWGEMNKPKAFELMENFHLLECLYASREDMANIEKYDPYLFSVLKFTFKLDAVTNKCFWFVIFVLLVGITNLVIEKNF